MQDEIKATEEEEEAEIQIEKPTIKTNGMSPTKQNGSGSTCQTFIQVEREYCEQQTPTVNGFKTNGHHSPRTDESEPENLENPIDAQLEELGNKEVVSPLKEEEDQLETQTPIEAPQPREQLSAQTDDDECEVQSGVTIETEDFDACSPKPSLDLSVSCLGAAEANKSVKDRMFLSTDDSSCLLFTQTVTSPMLTPSEENIDFLKGFRRDSSQNTLSENSNSPVDPLTIDTSSDPNEIVDVDNVEISSNGIGGINVEHEYEEVRCVQQVPDHIDMENIEVPIDSTPNNSSDVMNIYENVSFVAETKAEHEDQPIYENVQPLGEKFEEGEIYEETGTENVSALKQHFMSSEEGKELKSPKSDNYQELDELKSLNIMKQISRFEQTTQSDTTTNTNLVVSVHFSLTFTVIIACRLVVLINSVLLPICTIFYFNFI